MRATPTCGGVYPEPVKNLTGIATRRVVPGFLTLVAAAVALAGLATAPPARADSAVSPFVLQAGIGLSDQFGYAPGYTRNVPAFDSEGRAFIRSRTSSTQGTSYVDTLIDGSRTRLDFVSAIRLAYPGFQGTVGAGGLRNDSIVFDREDRAYNPLVIQLRDGTTRNILLVSLDRCRTWKVYPLPEGTFAVEHWVGHNEIDGPPFLAVWRRSGTPDVPGSQVNTLWVTQPRLEGDQLVVPPLVHVTDRCLGLSRDSGGASFAVTRGDKTWFVWSEATPRGQAGTTHYIATYDHTTGTMSTPLLLAKSPSKSDPHNKPGICLDSQGYLHVVCCGHGTPALYTRSLAPLSADQGWTQPVPVLSTGWVTGSDPSGQAGRQTYPAFVCDSRDVLHLITRQWRRGVDPYFGGQGYAALVHQSCPASDGTWSQPTIIVAGAYTGYGVFFHKLALDQQDRLFLSCSYQGGPELQQARAEGSAYAVLGRSRPLGPGKYRGRMLLVSGDGGATWRFATDADLAAPGQQSPPAGAVVRSARVARETRSPAVTWRWRNPRPQGNQFTGLSFSGARSGWAVGTHGTIRHTRDAGLTWTAQRTATTADLFGVAATGPRSAWVVGAGGTVLRTTDGGATWRSRPSGTSADLFAISALSATRAWVVGERGVILRTRDGGLTWSRQPALGQTLLGVAFADRLHGIACGIKGELLCTRDGGRTWQRRRSGASGSLFSASMLRDRRALVCGGNGLILTSRNAGWSWTQSHTGTTVSYRAVRLLKSGRAWALGPDTVLSSKNAGRRWTTVKLPVPGPCGALATVGKSGLMAGGAGGALCRSADLGRTWSGLGVGIRRTMNAVTVFKRRVWTVGDGGTLARAKSPGGRWTAVKLAKGADFYGLARFGARGWAVGEDGAVVTTYNGGSTWHRVTAPTGQDLTAAAAPSPGTVAIAGKQGTLLTSTDAGGTWHGSDVIPDDVLCLDFVDGLDGWAGGGATYGETRAEVARTVDGGLTWTEMDLPVWGRVHGLSFLDGGRGWAAVEDWGIDGDRAQGAVLATSDGGATWTRQAGTSAVLLGVSMSAGGSGWAWGERGTALRTVDGGATWTPVDAGTDSSLHAAAVSASEALFVGENGAVIGGAAR